MRGEANQPIGDGTQNWSPLAATADEFIVVTDEAWRIRFASPTAAAVFGMASGDSVLQFLHPRQRRLFAAHAPQTPTSRSRTWWVAAADGRYLRLRVSALRRTAGGSHELLLVARAAATSGQAPYDNSHGVIVHRNEQLLFVNQAFAEMLGYDQPERLVGLSLLAFIDPHERERMLIYSRGRAVGQPVPTTYELDALHSDGRMVRLQGTVTRIIWQGAPATRSTFIDVSDRWRCVQEREHRLAELEQAHDQVNQRLEQLRAIAHEDAKARITAEAASAAKSAFIANVSHELRTPLNAIIGFAEVMQRELFGAVGNDRYREYIDDIHGSGVDLLALIEDILDVTKAESGKLTLDPRVVEIRDAIDATAKLLAARAAKGDVEIAVDVSPACPAVHADPRRLRQIVLNLASNAIKFTPPGGAVIIAARPAPDDGLIIAVSDNGIGIEDKNIEAVFEPFFSQGRGWQANIEGTGLGLPLCRHLVELHGGTIRLDSKPGRGTLVEVYLPTAGAAAPEAETRADFLA